MSKLFYGISSANRDAEVKTVTVYGEGNANLIAPGDVLAVYFSNGNEFESPSLLLLNESENSTVTQENLSENSGISVKSRGVETDLDYMWQDGEVCLFTLISQQTNSDIAHAQTGDTLTNDSEEANDALYFILLRGSRANSEFYGLTLFSDHSEDFDTWLSGGIVDADSNTAVSAADLKRIVQQLTAGTTEPSTPISIPHVEYVSEAGEDATTIGKLYTSDDTWYEVKIPASVVNSIPVFTHEFKNDADIVPDENDNSVNKHNRASREGSPYNVGDYFITNVLKDNFYLTPGENNSSKPGIYLALPHTSTGQDDPVIIDPVEGSLKAYSLLESQKNNGEFITNINKGAFNNKDNNGQDSASVLNLYGSTTNFYAHGSVNPVLTIDPVYVQSTSRVVAPTFIENGESLASRYCGQIKVKTYTSCKMYMGAGAGKQVTSIVNSWTRGETHISSSGTAILNDGHITQPIQAPAGQGTYEPIGIVGYNLNYATQGVKGDAPKTNLWELCLVQGETNPYKVQYAASNLSNSVVNVYMTFSVLWRRVL